MPGQTGLSRGGKLLQFNTVHLYLQLQSGLKSTSPVRDFWTATRLNRKQKYRCNASLLRRLDLDLGPMTQVTLT